MNDSQQGLLTFYVRSLHEVFEKPRLILVFFGASLFHASAQGAVAIAAGACAQALMVRSSGAAMVNVMARGGWNFSSGGDPLLLFSPESAPLLFASLGLLALVVKLAGGVTASYAQAELSSRIGGSLRLRVLRGWMDLARCRRPGALEPTPTHPEAIELRSNFGRPARGIAALTLRVRDVESGLREGLLGGARSALQLAMLGAALVWMAPRLAFASAAVFVPFSVLLGHARRWLKRANGEVAQQGEDLIAASDEAIRHVDLWTTYGAEDKACRTVASLGDRITRLAARLAASCAALSGANEVLGASALVCALFAARAGWMGDFGSGGDLVPFAMTFFLAYRPIRDLSEARMAYARAEAAFEDVRGLTSEESTQDSNPSEKRRRPWPLASLEIRNLHLSRGDSTPIHLHVPPGSVVAIAGRSGSGKTTLIRTLLGLDGNLEGGIFYDGVRLDASPVGPDHRPFAWVPQDAPLLADTMQANIALGNDEADAAACLTSIGAGRLVAMADQKVGAGGRAMSGGEKQWIALARALATELPVLLFDEPTSGLDSESQAGVLAAISALKGERTILIVTHRKEPLAIADQVVWIGARGETSRMTHLKKGLSRVAQRVSPFFLLTSFGCGASPAMRAAKEGDLRHLSVEIERRERAGTLGNGEAADLATAVVARELENANGRAGLDRVNELEPCARELDDVLRHRARIHDAAGGEAALILFNAGKADSDDARRFEHDPEDHWRAFGARGLEEEKDGAARRRAFTDGSPLVRRAAMRASATGRSFADLDALFEAARLDPEAMNRTEAVRAIRTTSREKSRGDVASRFRDLWVTADEPLREDIAAALAAPSVYNEGGEWALQFLLASAHGPGVIRAATEVLSSVKRSTEPLRQSAIAALLRAIESGPRRERILAIATVPGGERLVEEAIKKASEDSDREVQVAALSRMLDNPRTRSYATRALEDIGGRPEPWSLSSAALRALAVAGDPRIQSWVERDLRSPSATVRLGAAETLAAMGRSARGAPLLADNDPSVRTRAGCVLIRGAAHGRSP